MMVMKLIVLIGGEVFFIITVPGFLSPLFSLISSKPIMIITNFGNLITTILKIIIITIIIMLKGLTKKDTSSSATAKNKNKNTQPKEEKPAQTRKAYGPRKTSAKDEQKQTKNEKREPKRKREQKNQLNQMIVPKPILRKGEYDHHSMNVGSSGGLASQIVENQKHKSKAKKAGSKKDDQKNNENNDDDGQEYDARGGMGAKRKRGMFARDCKF